MNGKSAVIFNRFHWAYLAGFFLIVILPFLSAPPWLHPPSFPKSILFRIILSSIIFVFIWQVLSQPDFYKEKLRTIKTSRAFWLLIALFGVFVLATIFSLEPYFSFWGSPYRGGGFLTFAFYIIFAIFAFLVLRRKDWKKVWVVAFLAGIAVSLIAIFQKFGLFSEILIPRAWQPLSTLGGPNFLALYILLLTFLSLSFGIIEKSKKKFFYLFAFALFIVTIFITVGRASYLGLVIGFLYFLFFYPASFRKLNWLKLLVGILLVSGIIGIYWLNTQPQLPQFIKESNILGPPAERLLIRNQLSSFQVRLSGWEISLNALKERPVLGYGPENVSIGFDKYFDPSLPGLGNSWWDRAHNIFLEIGVTAGIPALLLYLSLFGVLFLQLQKRKKYQYESAEISIDQRVTPVIAHGVQSTFLAYFIATLFQFNTFSTYLILFLLIGYSLHLISSNQKNRIDIDQQSQYTSLSGSVIFKLRGIIVFVLFVGLIWFIYSANLKPLQINKEINWAQFYSDERRCEEAVAKMESILPQKSYIDHYMRQTYADIIRDCLQRERRPLEVKTALAQKASQVLKENTEIRPYFTRNWLLLGEYTKFLAQGEKKESEKQKLFKLAHSYFEKAHQLSPERPLTLIPWTENYLKQGKYQEVKDKAEECLEIDPEVRECWWFKGVAHIYFGEMKEAEKAMEIAVQEGHRPDIDESLSQLANAYAELIKKDKNTEHLQALVEIHQKLVQNDPKDYTRHASLACAYILVGDYDKASEEAHMAVRSSPDWDRTYESLIGTVNEFLRNPEICLQ